MRFYVLYTSPEGDAETEFSEAPGSNQGDAAKCPACGEFVSLLTWLPPLRAELQLFGTVFGDFVFMGGNYDFLVSEKFRSVYFGHGLTGLFGFEPVEIVWVKSKRKSLPKPVSYFRVSVAYGGPALDLAASGFEWLKQPICPVCSGAGIVRWKRVVVNENTWHGEDAFRPRGSPGKIIVSQRFKDVCELNGIRNAVFLPAATYAHDFYPGKVTPMFKPPQ